MGNNPFEAYSGDVYLYFGDITRGGYAQVSAILEGKKSLAERACLVLITRGGDPDAGYRIARAFHHYYRHLDILIPDICKSAGTLVCIGASRLIFGDRGELGPLDIQLSKPDEMFESMSGLEIIQAMNALEQQVLSSFRTYLLDIRNGSRIRTSLAADIASKLADGFIAPIASKIDPITLGEHQRAMQIGFGYGQRLGVMAQSLKEDALVRLVSSYPSHGFVIDRKEACELFRHVEAPAADTMPIYEWARSIVGIHPYPMPAPAILDAKEQHESRARHEQDNVPSTDECGRQGDKQVADGQPEHSGAGDQQVAQKPARSRPRKGD